MEEFTLYGIENEKYQRLERMLQKVLFDLKLDSKVSKINDIDIIVRSGISSIPSLFYKDTLISTEAVLDESELREKIIVLSNKSSNGTKSSTMDQ
jgi:hypothetical protein